MKHQYTEMPILLSVGKRWDKRVPFYMLNEGWADRNHSQSLQILAERGGLGPCEALAIMDKRWWRKMDQQEALTELQHRLDNYSQGVNNGSK